MLEKCISRQILQKGAAGVASAFIISSLRFNLFDFRAGQWSHLASPQFEVMELLNNLVGLYLLTAM